MSYDLYLFSPQLSRDAFESHFRRRANYERAGWYANQDTGVYFSFEFIEPSEEEIDPETPPELRAPHVAFNANYFRPHIFGLEAEPEVAAFVAAFSCTISDPQMKGMGDAPYSSEGFLRGWNEGNSFGYRAIGAQTDFSDHIIASDEQIERVWRWNHHLKSKLITDHFVPTLFWAKRRSDNAAIVYAVWGEGVAIAVPEHATHALLVRNPRQGLFGKKKDSLEARLLPLEMAGSLRGCDWRQTVAGRVLFAPVSFPPSGSVRKAFNGNFEPLENILARVAVDHVLDASLVASTKRG